MTLSMSPSIKINPFVGQYDYIVLSYSQNAKQIPVFYNYNPLLNDNTTLGQTWPNM